MDYKKQLLNISQAILSPDQGSSQLSAIIDENSIERFSVYKKNYLHHYFGVLSSDYPALKVYLGENNFYFFAQNCLKKNGLSSPSISVATRQFKDFMISSYDLHKDDLIEDIVKIDLLWSQSYPQEVTVTSGMLEYWQELVSGEKSNKVINLDKLVKIILIDHNGEQAFKVLT